MLRLLIVEDEVLVGLCLREELAERGCEVVMAHDAESVLARGAERRIDGAILDISLPGLQGDELARQLRKQFPTVPIVLSTGVAIQEIADDLKQDTRVLVLQKPYSPVSLIHGLRQLGLRIREAPVARESCQS